jgi:hypothetical protein
MDLMHAKKKYIQQHHWNNVGHAEEDERWIEIT